MRIGGQDHVSQGFNRVSIHSIQQLTYPDGGTGIPEPSFALLDTLKELPKHEATA